MTRVQGQQEEEEGTHISGNFVRVQRPRHPTSIITQASSSCVRATPRYKGCAAVGPWTHRDDRAPQGRTCTRVPGLTGSWTPRTRAACPGSRRGPASPRTPRTTTSLTPVTRTLFPTAPPQREKPNFAERVSRALNAPYRCMTISTSQTHASQNVLNKTISKHCQCIWSD